MPNLSNNIQLKLPTISEVVGTIINLKLEKLKKRLS